MRTRVALAGLVTAVVLGVGMSEPTSAQQKKSAKGPSYGAGRTAAAHEALLGAEDAAWRPADTIVWGQPKYETRFRALWTERAIYVRFDSVDPNPWHTMTKKDDHLWDEEVVEVFFDPSGQGFDYFELEINPANVVCDVRMLSAYPNVKSDLAWDHAGLETRVVPLRDGAGATVGWTATAFIPFDGFKTLPVPAAVALPPRAGDTWKFNVYRIKRPNGPADPKSGALFEAWSKTGTPSFHTPSAFRAFTFR
jgi:hypothetical protein